MAGRANCRQQAGRLLRKTPDCNLVSSFSFFFSLLLSSQNPKPAKFERERPLISSLSIFSKNVSTTAPIALSVIHGSRQRSNRMSCAQPDLSSRTPSPPRNMVEDLRTYLSRSNKYNNQHICHVPPPPAQRPPTRVTPPLRPSDQTSVVARPVPPSYPMSLAPGLTPLTDRSMQYVNIAGIPGAPFAYLAQPAMGGYCFLAPITMFSAPQAFAPGYLRPTNSLYRRNDENDPRVGIQRYW